MAKFCEIEVGVRAIAGSELTATDSCEMQPLVFFCAAGPNGKDVMYPSLAPRDGTVLGGAYGPGRIALRQMQWSQFRYRNFQVWELRDHRAQ